MTLTLAEIAAILGSSTSSPERQVETYSIDSRTAEPGALFFAILGPRFDGHAFVAQALERAAVAAVVNRSFAVAAPASLASSLVAVDDTERALQDLARAVRRRWGGPVVGITGSTGKTTTKELIAAVLAGRFGAGAVLKSDGNLNNHYGVPLSLLRLQPQHRVAVLEMAMSGPGEIALLASIAEPQTGVVTNVAPVHLEFFRSIEEIAHAKRELIENLRPPRVAILNHDDPRVRRFAESVPGGFEGRVLTYGFELGADLRGLDWQAQFSGFEAGMTLRVKTRDDEEAFEIPLPGQYNAENVLAAIATAIIFGVPLDAVQSALRHFRALHQRSEVLRLNSGVTVINDCYNSNPRAMAVMLETLAAWPGARRRIVVAGEMLELGPSSPEFHRQIGRQCVEAGVNWLIAVQGGGRFFREGAIAAGLPAERTRFFEEAGLAAEFCRSLVKAGDVVLVKGSRGVHLEQVTETLQTGEAPGSTIEAKPGLDSGGSRFTETSKAH